MRRALCTTVAAGALSLGLSAAFAQTNSPAGGADTAPGQMKPPATTSAPGASEAAPGQNRPNISTNAPGQSERAPGQTRDTGSTAATSSQDGSAVKPPAQGASPSQPSSSSAASDSKASPNGTQQRTGQTTGSSGDSRSSSTQPSQSSSSSTKTDKQGQTQSTTGGQTTGQGSQQRSTAGSPQQPGTTSATTQSSQQPGTASSTTQSSQSGTAGAASVTSATANLNTQERTQVTQAFTSTRVEPVTNVSFSVSVGSAVTDEVRLYDVPADVVRIVPQYRGYRYFVVQDEIVIVEPRTKKIVEVIHKSGRNSASTSKTSKGSVKLSSEQRKTLRSGVETTGSTRTTTRTTIDLREGLTLPEDVELYDVPTTIVSDEPELQSYRYVVIGDEIGLVDPQTRRVVTIVEE
jgi:hypothetical protein